LNINIFRNLKQIKIGGWRLVLAAEKGGGGGYLKGKTQKSIEISSIGSQIDEEVKI